MSVPEHYSSAQLAEFMHRALGTLAPVLGWTPPESYDESVIQTLIALDVDSLEEIDDMRLLRLTARVEVWRSARDATAGLHNIGSVGREANMDLGSVHTHAANMFRTAQQELDEYLHGVRRARRIPIVRSQQPYHRQRVRWH